MKTKLYGAKVFVIVLVLGAEVILLNSLSIYANSEDALINKAKIALQQGDEAMNQARTLQSASPNTGDTRKQPAPSKAEVQALKAKAAEAKEKYNAQVEERRRVFRKYKESWMKLQEKKEEETLAREQWYSYRNKVPPDLSREATTAKKAFENASAVLRNAETKHNEMSSKIESLDREILKLETTWNQLRQEARQAEKTRWMATDSPLRDTAQDVKSKASYKEAREAYERAKGYALDAHREITRKAEKLNQDFEKAKEEFTQADRLWFDAHKAYSSSLFAHPFNERRSKELIKKWRLAEKERLEAQKRQQAASEKVTAFQAVAKLRECVNLISEAGRKLSSSSPSSQP